MTHIRQRISDSRRRKSRNQFGGMVNGILIGMLLAILGVIALMIFMNNNQAKFSESASQPKPKPAIKKAEILRPVDNVDNSQVAPVHEEPLIANPPNVENNSHKIEVGDNKETSLPSATATKDTPKNKDELANIIENINKKDNKEVKETKTNKSGVLQIGSFFTPEQAEAQRAKLSMIGVESRIVQAQVNGRNVYRVRSGSLNQSQMQSVQQRLSENNIESIIVSN